MHYKIHGMLIKSENAAKPGMTAAKPLLDWLKMRPRTDSALDFGCGKLRYTPILAANSNILGIVDSREQLDRVQLVNGQQTIIRQYAKRNWPNCRVYDLQEFYNGINQSFEFILCANVLSAIPSETIRAKSLNGIRKVLSRNGRVLVVNQHSNSSFTDRRKNPNAKPYLDGWVLKSHGKLSYFGILSKEKTIKLLNKPQ